MIILVVVVWAIVVIVGVVLIIYLLKERKNNYNGRTFVRHGIRIKDKELKNSFEDRLDVVGKDDFGTIINRREINSPPKSNSGWVLQMKELRTQVQIRAAFYQSIEIGRAKTELVQGAFLKINDHEVSRRHCKIFYDGIGFWLEDLGSKNHTYLNGAEVKECVLVKSGALLGIGTGTYQITIIERG